MTPEFSRRLSLAELPSRGVTRKIEAGPAERAALAARFDLLALDRLEAEVTARPIAGGRRVEVRGRLLAEVTQACVVTLRPVPARVTDDFTLLFGEADVDDEAIDPADLAYDADIPEPIEGGGIDLGEAVAQQLSLALDPYPRAAGAAVPEEYDGEEAEVGGEGDEEEKASPFAVLADLKGRD